MSGRGAYSDEVFTPANERLYGKPTSGTAILVNSKLRVPHAADRCVEAIRSHMAAAVAQSTRAARFSHQIGLQGDL